MLGSFISMKNLKKTVVPEGILQVTPVFIVDKAFILFSYWGL